MASKFYSDIIEEEKKQFKIEEKSLKTAAKSIAAYHSIKSLGKRQSFQPSVVYNKPTNRCVYLYKYATINTGLVAKYFRKLAFKKDVKNTLHFKKNIELCCLGGGPGTDVFGIFRALAVSPSLHGKISKVTVLDICNGWDNTFNSVISGLLAGKVKDVPATFTNQKKFSHELIEVDLLDPLPENVKKIVSNADIVCMSRFVSDLLGDGRSSYALKVLGNFFKLGALVLCIDIFNDKVFELAEDISKDNGFEIVLSPLHEKFFRGSASGRNVYGYDPQCAAKFSIIGWRKTSITSITRAVFGDGYSITNNSGAESEISSAALDVYDFEDTSLPEDVSGSLDNNLEDLFDSESLPLYTGDSRDNSLSVEVFDSEDNSAPFGMTDSEDESRKEYFHSCHAYTQTESDFLTPPTSSEEDLLGLMKALSNFISVTEQWKQKRALRRCCCCYNICHIKQAMV